MFSDAEYEGGRTLWGNVGRISPNWTNAVAILGWNPIGPVDVVATTHAGALRNTFHSARTSTEADRRTFAVRMSPLDSAGLDATPRRGASSYPCPSA